MENKPDKIIIHHTAAEAPIPQFDAVNEWHRVRDFIKSSLGYFVGYHYLIEKDGTVRQAKEENEEGCHTIGQNLSSIAVCLVGDFSKVDPTTEQTEAMAKLVSELCRKYNIPVTNIFPHRHFASTACYGSRLENNWPILAVLGYEIMNRKILNLPTRKKK